MSGGFIYGILRTVQQVDERTTSGGCRIMQRVISLRCNTCGAIEHDYTDEPGLRGFEPVKHPKSICGHTEFTIITKASMQIEILEKCFVQVSKMKEAKE